MIPFPFQSGQLGYASYPQAAASGLAYVGGTSGGGTTTTYNLSISGTLTGGLASSPATGDIVIVATAVVSSGASAPSCSGNISGAYTGLHTNFLTQGASANANFRVFYKIQGATPDSTLTLAALTAGFPGIVAVQVWRGVNSTTPIDVTTTVATGINSQIDPNSITPVTSGAVIIAAGACAQPSASGATPTAPSGMINPVTLKFDGTSHDLGVVMASHAWTSGAYNPAAVTGASISASHGWGAMTLALRPA